MNAELISRAEVITLLERRFRPRQARQLIRRVPPFPHGLHKRRLYRPEDVTRWIEEYLNQKPETT